MSNKCEYCGRTCDCGAEDRANQAATYRLAEACASCKYAERDTSVAHPYVYCQLAGGSAYRGGTRGLVGAGNVCDMYEAAE